jgi:hypothetical protein
MGDIKMSFLLGSNADFLFPVVSSVSVLTVQDLTPASISSGKREPFVGLAGSSLTLEVPTADTNLFQSRLLSVTKKLDLDLGSSDDDYESLVINTSRSLQDNFHILLQKLDNDPGVTDDDYYSSLSYSGSGYFTVNFNSLMDKLDSDTHLSSSDFGTLKISELQIITVNFNQDLTYASEVASVISQAVGSSGNIEVSSRNGFVIINSIIKGSEASISIKNTNQSLGFFPSDSYGTNHALLSVSADISVVMVSPTLAAVSVFLDRNTFVFNKPYFIILNDGSSQQVERLSIIRQNLGSANFTAGV